MTYDYSQHEESPPTNILSQIAKAAREQRAAEAEVDRLAEELKKAKAALERISQVQLPELMKEARQEVLRTEDGIQVELTEIIRASVPEKRSAEAFAWLRANDHGGLIRHTFSIEFGKDQEKSAEGFAKNLQTNGVTYLEKRAVHPKTLESFVRQQLKDGNPIPQELFGVFRQKLTRITVRD